MLIFPVFTSKSRWILLHSHRCVRMCFLKFCSVLVSRPSRCSSCNQPEGASFTSEDDSQQSRLSRQTSCLLLMNSENERLRKRRLESDLSDLERLLCLWLNPSRKRRESCLLPFQIMQTGHFLTMSLIKRNSASIGRAFWYHCFICAENHAALWPRLLLFDLSVSFSCPGEAGRVDSFNDRLWLTSLSILMLAKQANSCYDILFAVDIPCVFVFIYNSHRLSKNKNCSLTC